MCAMRDGAGSCVLEAPGREREAATSTGRHRCAGMRGVPCCFLVCGIYALAVSSKGLAPMFSNPDQEEEQEVLQAVA